MSPQALTTTRNGQLRPPLMPTPPATPRLDPIPDNAALPAAPLQLPPSPISSSSSSSSLRISLPRIIVTVEGRSVQHIPWSPCRMTRLTYDPTYLGPPSRRETDRQQRCATHAATRERIADLRNHTSERRATRMGEELKRTFHEGSSLADFDMLRPICRDLVAWRLLSFYGVPDADDIALCARSRILSRGVDWNGTWEVLRRQQRQYESRQRRTLGLLPERASLSGLTVLSAVHMAAVDTGVSTGQLRLAIEAFAKHLSPVTRVSVRNLAAHKEWVMLAKILLQDEAYLTPTPSVIVMLFPHQRIERFNDICAAREEAARGYFSVLEDEEERCSTFPCLFPHCMRKRKINFRLSKRENARLEEALEPRTQLVAALPDSQKRPEDEGRGECVSKMRVRRKSVRISVDEEQERKSSNKEAGTRRGSWDSVEETLKRRRERREFIFGKEDEDEAEAYDRLDGQERKRRESADRVMAANAKWTLEYADSDAAE